MKKLMKISLMVVVGLLFTMKSYAQDPQFSQFYAAPLYLDPGFTGITYSQRVTFNHRLQWPSLPQVYSTYSASYDIFVPELKSGFGVMAMTDKMGSGALRTTTAGLLYSYKIRINENWVASPGLYFGYGTVGIDRDKLLFGDGVNTGGQTTDPFYDALGNKQFFDFASGIVIYNKNLWFGMSSYHMNKPDFSLTETVDRTYPKYNFHGGMRLELKNGIRTSTRVSYLTPSFVYRVQGPFQQLDAGLHYHIDPVMIGVWYRGIPFQKDFNSKAVADAIVFILGLQLKNFQIGYSYDFTISELGTTVGGSHEVSVVYEFIGKPIKGRPKKSTRLLPCPTFSKRKNFWK